MSSYDMHRSGGAAATETLESPRAPVCVADVRNVLARDGIARLGTVLEPDDIRRSIGWFNQREAPDDQLVKTLQPRFDIAPDGTRRLAKVRRVYWSDPDFWSEIFVTSRIVALAVELVGPSATLLFHTGFLKPAGIGAEAMIHQDQAFWQWNYPEAVTIWMALTPSRVENGCMIGYPGSHRRGLIPHVLGDGTIIDPPSGRALTDLYRTVRSVPSLPASEFAAETPALYELEPGEAIVWDRYFVHGSRENHSTLDRKGMAVVFADASRPDFVSPDFDCAGRKLDGVEGAVSVAEIRDRAARRADC